MAAGVVSRLASGFLADRIGGVKTLLVGSTLQCLALFLYIPFDGLASLYVVSLVFGLSQGGIVPCYAIIVREYMPAAEAGQRIGIVILATIAGMAVGGWMRVDLRPDRLLRGGVPERHRLEPAKHADRLHAAMEIGGRTAAGGVARDVRGGGVAAVPRFARSVECRA